MFNMLTGSRQYVGNRPGVTVEQKTGQLRNHKGVAVVDLPGIYSLSPYTMEEVVTRNYLLDEHPNGIINLVDASNIERNLYLTTQLWETGLPVLIALNMIDVAEKNGDKIDVKKLSRLLDCEIVPTSALHGEGLGALCEAAIKTAKRGEVRTHFCRFSPRVEAALSRIEALIAPDAETLHMRYYTIKVFERDEKVVGDLKLSAKKRGEIEAIIKECETAYDDDSDSIIISQRYDYITDIVRQCVIRHEVGTTASERVDDVMTNRYLALPLFVLIMCGVYYLSVQSLGAFATDWMEKVVGRICDGVSVLLHSMQVAAWMEALIVDGLLRGVGAVLCFVPQLFILFLFLSLLEDCGYMARIAFMMDRVFRRFGLSGKSFIPLLVSSGCGVPGIMASRTIESESARRLTVMTTTFMPCSAKLPIIALIATAIFGGVWWVAPLAYFMGIAAIIISGIILRKTRPFMGKVTPYVMELPEYRLPRFVDLLRSMWDRAWAFIKKAGTIILLATIVVWFLSGYGIYEGKFMWVGEDLMDYSFLAYFGNAFAWIFAPLGFNNWECASTVITGLIAKENVISTMAVVYGGDPNVAWTSAYMASLAATTGSALLVPVAAFAFMTFQLLCAPCFAAMGAIKREMGGFNKWFWAAIGWECGFAYVISLIIFQIGAWVVTGVFSLGTIVAIVFVAALLWALFRPASKPAAPAHADTVVKAAA